MVWSIHHGSSMWVIVEHPGRFWMVIQGKEKWKIVNEVHNTPDGGHDTLVLGFLLLPPATQIHGKRVFWMV